ncbi:hypothetical protein [Pseudooceanicola sp.]
MKNPRTRASSTAEETSRFGAAMVGSKSGNFFGSWKAKDTSLASS